MQKLKQFMDYSGVHSHNQNEILRMIEGHNLIVLSEEDFINALSYGEEIVTANISRKDIKEKNEYFQHVTDYMKNSEAMISIFEINNADELNEDDKLMMKYVCDNSNVDALCFLDFKLVADISEARVMFLFAGYKKGVACKN